MCDQNSEKANPMFKDQPNQNTKPTLNLDPLRTSGIDALTPNPDGEITAITLREVEIAWDNELRDVLVRKSDDLFASALGISPAPKHPLGHMG